MKVTLEDPRLDPDQVPRARLRLAPVALGITALVAIGVVATAGFESVNDQPTLDTDQVLSEQVAGLDGSLQLIAERGTDTYHLGWEPDRPRPTETRLDVRNARLNADGSLVAGLGRTIGDLWVGTPDTITPVNADTLSFLWHQSDPNKLASIRLLGGQHQLWLGERVDDGTFVFSTFAPVAEGLTIAAYGEWGLAVHNQVPAAGVFFIQVFDLAGSEVDRRSGRVLGSWPGPDGGIALDEGEGQITLLTPADTAELELPNRAGVRSLLWNATRTMVAAWFGDQEMEVTAAGVTIAEAAGRPLRWVGSNGVLVGGPGSVGYLDLDTATVEALEVNGTVVDALVGG